METELMRNARKLRIETGKTVTYSIGCTKGIVLSELTKIIDDFCFQYKVTPNYVMVSINRSCDSWHPDAEPKDYIYLKARVSKSDAEIEDEIAIKEFARTNAKATKTERKEKALAVAQNRVDKLNKELGRLL